MSGISLIIVAVVIGYFLFRGFRERTPPQPQQWDPERLYGLASSLEEFFANTAHPADLRTQDGFMQGVRLMERFPEQLVSYILGDNQILSCMALEALRRNDYGANYTEYLQSSLNILALWPRYFALEVLSAHIRGKESLVGPLLLHLDGTWSQHPSYGFLAGFIDSRVEAGESPSFGTLPEHLEKDQVEWLANLLSSLGPDLTGSLAEELQAWRLSLVDKVFLNSIGRIWEEDALEDVLIEHPGLAKNLADVENAFAQEPPRSVLLIGAQGVGKTSIVKSYARRLREKGWVLFEAGHGELLAGQIYVGQFEERLKALFEQVSSVKPVVWYIPDFHLLYWTGRSHTNPVSVLPALLRVLERGELRIIAETTPRAFEKLALSEPRCQTVFERIQLEPMSVEGALDLARSWLEQCQGAGNPSPMAPEVLEETAHLASQFQAHQASPGHLINLLKTTFLRLQETPVEAEIETDPVELINAPRMVTLDDVIATLSSFTGLPKHLLDGRQTLDLNVLRGLFEERVMGQPEAVDCLIERIAMIKAGVTDPTRPYGVFLFAGPTGTGKTEIAKTLAESLFGSPDRMIRIDMSECQNPDSKSRIIGDSMGQPWETQTAGTEGNLAEQIRRQPFSVILLDEFEKAHSLIWNLFLQVFDDGRLTDARGNAADFRNALIILTSNLGSAVPSGLRMGFSGEQRVFSPNDVGLAIDSTFSKEFLNRLDRVVIFRPLGREIIREILQKELREALQRRGLRNRSWSFIWDNDAVEFLIEQGFTVDMGARPLKRAVERHLLTPLAMSMANQTSPEGEQFLFVQLQENHLEVEFVDPNLDDSGETSEDKTSEVSDDSASQESGGGSIAAILKSPKGTPSEIARLGEHLERIRSLLDSEGWRQNKQTGLDLMNQADFWSSVDRFSILGELEYVDRIDAAFESASYLCRKLRQFKGKERVPIYLTQRLAQLLFLLDLASETVQDRLPRDAFLRLWGFGESEKATRESSEFARRMARMYQNWAHKRKMKMTILSPDDNDSKKPYRFLAAVSGFGAHLILAAEAGLHILELPGGGSKPPYARVSVQVAPQTDLPTGSDQEQWRKQAREALESDQDLTPVIVRRYRESPSPLVRDSRKRWRTGRLDRVLDGDFDLYGR